MYKKYLVSSKDRIPLDKYGNNFYMFDKNKIPYVMDILFLKNKYKLLIDNKLKK